jgi:hypothetical protein
MFARRARQVESGTATRNQDPRQLLAVANALAKARASLLNPSIVGRDLLRGGGNLDRNGFPASPGKASLSI